SKDLPNYMVPALFVVINRVPLTENGKVNRKALPIVSLTRESSNVDYMEPKTNMERLLADIWSDFLHIKAIGIHDNFFDLGGHSIIAVNTMSEIERQTGK